MTTVQHAHALSSAGEGSAVESAGLPEEPPPAERDATFEDGMAEEGPAPVDTAKAPDEAATALSAGDVG